VSAVSPSLAASLHQQFAIEEPAVLPNVVDQEFLSNLRSRRSDESFAFLSGGNLDENKNHALLLEAFARRFRGARATLRIAGDGPCRARLTEQARRLGIEAQVSFLGWLDKPGMLRELGAADCFVLPSRYETFGVVLIEALASGVPVIATRCGGPEGVVTPECGLIVEPDDVEALANAMVRMRESHAAYEPGKLKRYAGERFGAAAYAAQLSSLAERAMSTVKSVAQ
jgi:glycosyltransferase involved in cell wall biosynthesis